MSRPTENESFYPASDYSDPRLKISLQHRRVRFDGAILLLPDREFDVLAVLAANEGHPVSRQALLTKLWNFPPTLKSRTLDVHIHRLRSRLNDTEGAYLETVFGVGYRFRRFGNPAAAAPHSDAAPEPDGGSGARPKPMSAISSQSMAAVAI
ncbi:MAG: winged helix-turn-helix domain-containing protein [Acidobacteria bacterium]|nr:winged helix-turn-helix domain-containing protein [Acidobacteriota bacterium]